jgi:hypothetical protein
MEFIVVLIIALVLITLSIAALAPLRCVCRTATRSRIDWASTAVASADRAR